MNDREFRSEPRRLLADRRLADRRIIADPYGSVAWIENIENAYLAWPRQDRRTETRRCEERRVVDRRLGRITGNVRSSRNYSKQLLTRDERLLIESLHLGDAE
ncbi:MULTISPECIES: hypothetical protein [Methylomonas]|uniref:Uncharacterized protein n=1 Tax=Methylomonas koyamae TaxID=702114 RepID=A0A177N629_9GAMM|nr:hypothetical protein [Methylomonas koyamae]OAI13488.1 hypothetical protein A1355_13345 [Methylomonas koyamae]